MRVAKPLLFFLCLLPALIGAWGFYADRLGANPVEASIHSSGDWALRLLLATLALSPLRRAGWSGALRFRRMVGLFAFFYAALHFTLWLWLDRWFLWPEIAADLFKRPYITVGFTAQLLLLPLALTSTGAMIRRLGRNWRRLHRLVYPAAALAVLHFLWKAKGHDYLEVGIYGAVLALLLAERVVRRFAR
ncbi:protein-methionine-sulfoxide reductase heme-binding subunit MsrQ [Endothiovibrio diazotrophicus]